MSLADEYMRQKAWRSWKQAYDRLPLQADDLVLDLGCAIGDQAADLAQCGARVVGIDSNPELLATAVAREIPGASFIQADLATWNDPSHMASGVWCSFTSAYFPDLSPRLSAWTRALRPGGWIAMAEVDDLFGHDPLRQLTRAMLDRYADEAAAADRYDFRMGRKLAVHAEAAGLIIEEELKLPDEELSFRGAASPEVLGAWRARLERMPLLHSAFGRDWPRAREEFLACLASPDHSTTATVGFVLARRPW